MILREALESFYVKFACETFLLEEMQTAWGILAGAKENLRQGNIRGCYALNNKFHDFFIQQISDDRIIQAYSNLRTHLDRYRNIASLILGRVAKSHQAHVLIFKASEQKDGVQAEQRMTEHLQSVLNDFLHSKELRSFCR